MNASPPRNKADDSLPQQLAALRGHTPRTDSVHEHEYQRGSHSELRTAYLVVTNKQPALWSATLDLSPEVRRNIHSKPNSKHNPLCKQAYLGYEVRGMLNCAFDDLDVTSVTVFKVALTLFGDELGLRYHANTGESTCIHQLLEIFGEHPGTHEWAAAVFGEHATPLLEAARMWRQDAPDTQLEGQYLWHHRHTHLNRAIVVASHHYHAGLREMMMSVGTAQSLSQNNNVVRVEVSRSMYKKHYYSL